MGAPLAQNLNARPPVHAPKRTPVGAKIPIPGILSRAVRGAKIMNSLEPGPDKQRNAVRSRLGRRSKDDLKTRRLAI